MGEAEREVGTPIGTAGNGQRTPAEIEAEIERTREELGDTVAALAEKPAQVAQSAKATATEPRVLIGAAVAAGLVIGLLVLKKRRAADR